MAQSNLKVVATPTQYRVVEETVRPYRIWDDTEKHDVPHRCYVDLGRAHIQALIQIRWKFMKTVTVYDIRTGAWRGTYKQGTKGVEYSEPNSLVHDVRQAMEKERKES